MTEQERLAEFAKYIADNANAPRNKEFDIVLLGYQQLLKEREDDRRTEQASAAREPQPEFFDRVKEQVMDIGPAISRAARGPEGLPDLGQFNPMGGSIGQEARAGIGTGLTTNPQAQANIIQNEYPDTEIVPIVADGKTYNMAFQDVDAADRPSRSVMGYDYGGDDGGDFRNVGYINPPGFDQADASRVTAQGAAFVPAAIYGGKPTSIFGTGLVSRAVRGFGGGAATDLALQETTQRLGSGVDKSYKQALVTGLFGAVLEPFAPLAKAAWGKIFTESRHYNPSTGQLTNTGWNAAIRAGLDPETFNQKMAQEFSRLSEGGFTPDDILEVATMGTEFNIPLTRGQAAQDARALALEENMRAGVEGNVPMQVMKDLQTRQAVALDQAQRQVQGELAPGARPRDTAGDAGLSIKAGVSAAEARMSTAVDDAYDAVRAAGDVEFKQFSMKFLSRAIAAADREVDEVLTPASNRAFKSIAKLIASKNTKTAKAAPVRPGASFEETLEQSLTQPKTTSTGNVSIGTLDTAKKRLNKFYDAAANDSDRANIQIMRKAIDRYVDEASALGLFSGSDDAIRQLKTARVLRTEYGRMFDGKNAGSKMVSDILNKSESPEQVVNYIFGMRSINKQTAINGVKKLKETLGEGPAWNSVREAAWLRLSRNNKNEVLSPKEFSDSWKKAMTENKTLMNELFSPNEQVMMRRYNKAINATRGPSASAPGKVFAIETAIRYFLRRSGQRESFVKGNIWTGAALSATARLPVNPLGAADSAKARVARRAVSPFETPRQTAPIVPATGMAAGRDY